MHKTQASAGAGEIVPAVQPAVSNTAARLAFVLGAATLIILAALHLLSPEFDPSWRMVSEYALGSYGWVLSLMHLAWAASSAALFFALRLHVRTASGKIGLGLLLISTIGAGLAAIFDINHSLHGLTALLGIPTLPIAAVLISMSLLRNPEWSYGRRTLLLAANFTWVSLVLFVGSVIVGLSQSGGQFGPDVPLGWPNRLLVVAYCFWYMVAARLAMQIDRR